MYTRRSLLSVQDSRSMRKAARNNKYLHSLRLKNLRSAVKKKLRNVKKLNRKAILKKRKIVVRKTRNKENDSQSTSNSLMIRQEEVKGGTEVPSPSQQTEESLGFDTGNKHTRSFLKRCNEISSIYIPCDYKCELSVRKTWPWHSPSNNWSEQELHESDQLQCSIREVMKDSLDLVLGYCFLHIPEEIETVNTSYQSVQKDGVLDCDQTKIEKSVNDRIDCNLKNTIKPVEISENDIINCVKSVELSENYQNHKREKHLCSNEDKDCFFGLNNLRNCSLEKGEVDVNFEFSSLPEKCGDLNISEFLRPHLSPCRTKKTIESIPKQILKNSRQNELLFHNLYSKFGNTDEAVLKIIKDHSYAKINKELTLRENRLTNNTDANCTLYVNKESSPKQYRNPKRVLYNGKDVTFHFGTRSKIKNDGDCKITKINENVSSYNKPTVTKHNQVKGHSIEDVKKSNVEVKDTSFLKDLVMDTALLYSMLCGVEPEDIAFYIDSRPMDPDQWAIDILDSINVH